ncbi:amidohydrolase [[Clostridium] fimetarium]|uniref:Amidohydrolase 3 domain-containing protein n=1 Tax=[Clostridium] fimetarium TaxID=99656 RepID=A0A1I0RKG8_9FIRM|nr:amidohydrolase family protein [[Clostridium] fimetarium]SEW41479.1 hypothetical protein SAMN05421659_11757 [[Clostridium] fimetarium]
MVKEYFCDIIFINAKVITVDEKDSIKEAVGILGNKIIFVGTTEKAMLYRGKFTKLVDVRGKSIIPGFIDSYIHFAMYGLCDNGVTSAGLYLQFTDEELLNGMQNANSIMVKYGITSVHDSGSYGMKAMSLLQKACEENLIDVRVRPMVSDLNGKESGKEYINHFLNTGIYTNMGDDKFKLGPIKIMTDGSASVPSSAAIKPYSHDNHLNGLEIWQQDEADEMVMKVHKLGYQMTAHAVGDKAVELMVNAYEKALTKYPRVNHRHRIEYCGLNNPDLIKRIKKLGIIPVATPSAISLNGSDYNRFYGERVDYMFPLKSYLEEGIIAAIGSDCLATTLNPMYSIYGAVNRMDIETKQGCGLAQKVDILDVIRMFTYNGAYASFEEDKKGSIEVGKLADLVMLSEDITAIHPDKLMEVEVLMTIIDGKIVYTKY